MTAAAIHVAIARALGASTWVESASAAMARAVGVMPAVAATVWLLAAAVGAQALALAGWNGERDGRPAVVEVWRRLAPRLLGALAASTLVVVHVALLGLLGAAGAAGLAWLPLGVLPRLGVGEATARLLTLLVLLPLLVVGAVPALWWLGRHAMAIPLQVLAGGSAWASLRRARAATRGHAGSLLGLLLVTLLANQAVVLLTRAAGSLLTLIVAPEQFRPIFGEGPLRSTGGASVQIGATLLASLVTLPLVLLPLSVFCLSLTAERERQS